MKIYLLVTNLLKTISLCVRSLKINHRWKSINEPEIYIICLNPFINVSNFINCTWKPPLSSVERDWASMIAEQRQGAQQNVAELCRSVVSPPWGVTERAEAQTIVARPSPVVTRNFKNRMEAWYHRRGASMKAACCLQSQLNRQSNLRCARWRLTAVPVRLPTIEYNWWRSTALHDGQIFHRRSTAEVLNISKLPYGHRRHWRPVALGGIHPRLCLRFVALNCVHSRF